MAGKTNWRFRQAGNGKKKLPLISFRMLVHTSWRKSQKALTTLVFSSSSSMSPSDSTEKTLDQRMLGPSLRCARECKEPKVLGPDDGPVFPSPLSRRELETSAKLRFKCVRTNIKESLRGGKWLYCINKKVHIKYWWLPSLCRWMKRFNSYSLVAVGPMIHLTRPPTTNSLRFSRFELELAWIHQ